MRPQGIQKNRWEDENKKLHEEIENKELD